MSDLDLLDEVVRAIVADVDARTPPKDGLDRTVWRRVTDAGLDVLLVPTTAGGPGASFRDLAVVLKAVGRSAASVPILEANLAAAVLANFAPSRPSGPLTLAVTTGGDGSRSPRGRLEGVPYGRSAGHVVWVRDGDDGGAEIALVDTADVRVDEDSNIAGEPRDLLHLSSSRTEPVGILASPWNLRIQAAACRALLLVGALERVRDLTVSYAHEREQFGRPLSRFQAVQHLMVETIVVTETARAIADRMAEELSSVDEPAEAAAIVAAARATAGRSATAAARCAHQVHGAIGFTMEHPLQASTRRLMAWRDENGSQAAWSRWLGRHVRSQSAPGAAWRLITAGTADRPVMDPAAASS